MNYEVRIPRELENGVTSRGAIAIYASGFFGLSMIVIMSLAVPLWTVVLHLSPVMTGLVLGAPALLPLLFTIHIGTLMDQTDVRVVMLVPAIAGAILPLLYPLLPWIPALFALQCLSGFSYQLTWVGAQTAMGRAFPGNRRNYGRFSSAASVGMFIGPLLDGFAWSRFGPWGSFALAALWGLGLTLTALVLPRFGDGSGAKPLWRTKLVPDFASYIAAFRLLWLPAILLVVLASFLRISAGSVRGSFYSVYLSHDAHLSGAAIGILLAFSALIGSVAALLAESIVRLSGSARRALIASLALAIVGVSITPLMPTFAMLAVAMAIYGVGMGTSQPLMLAILSSAVSYEYQGVSSAIRVTANLIAGVIIPVGMGLIIAAMGTRNGFYMTGIILLAACVLVAIITREATAGRHG